MATKAQVIVTRRQRDHARVEEMHAELIGGPFDGTRLILDVVLDGPDQVRVLERGYTAPQVEVLRSSEVES